MRHVSYRAARPDESDEKEVHMSNTPANPNQAPAPAASATKAPKSIAAIVGLILGIIALVLSAMPIINNFAFILGVVGLIFGIVGVVGTRDKKKSGKGMAVASVIIAALACVIVLASQAVYSAALDEAGAQLDKATGDATEEILGSEVDVTLGDLTMKKGSYGMVESSMPITVKNLTDESHSYQIQVEAVNASGDRITQDYAYMNDLAAGQSQTVKAFTYVSSDEYDAMKKATVKLVSVSQY
jgi:hypothetical protein